MEFLSRLCGTPHKRLSRFSCRLETDSTGAAKTAPSPRRRHGCPRSCPIDTATAPARTSRTPVRPPRPPLAPWGSSGRFQDQCGKRRCYPCLGWRPEDTCRSGQCQSCAASCPGSIDARLARAGRSLRRWQRRRDCPGRDSSHRQTYPKDGRPLQRRLCSSSHCPLGQCG